MLRRLSKKHPAAAFYVIALLIVCAVMAIGVSLMISDPAMAAMLPSLWAFIESRNAYGNLLEIAVFAIEVQPAAILILLFAAAPAIAAVIVTAAMGGRGALKTLASRFRPWRDGVTARQGVKVYAILLLVYFAGGALYLWLTNALAGPFAFDRISLIVGGTSGAVFATMLTGLFLDEGATLEELGWRGFLLPLLLQGKRSPLVVSLIVGLLWWAWHLPRDLPGFLLGGVDPGVYLIGQGIFLLLCFGLSIIITYVFNLTGGSVWAGILVHGGTNVWSKAFGGMLNDALIFDLRTFLVIVIAVVILVISRGNLGRRNGGARELPA